MKKDLIVTLADKNYVTQAKQLFSSIYFNSGWKGDYMLISDNIPEEDLDWFKKKGIIIKKFKPISERKWGRWPTSLLLKFNIFKPEFKKWKTIICLDADIIVRASLDKLKEVKKIAAIPGETNFKDKMKRSSFPKELFKKIEKDYDLNFQNLNGGMIVINSSIIKKETFKEIISLVKKYENYLVETDEAILGLYFNKKIESLPKVYNALPIIFNNKYIIKFKDVDGIIIHFVPGMYEHFIPVEKLKPWHPQNYFYPEWKKNLDKADLINLKKRLHAGKIWTNEEIIEKENFYNSLKKRHSISMELMTFILKIKGIIGKNRLFIKYNHPRLYYFIKKFIKQI